MVSEKFDKGLETICIAFRNSVIREFEDQIKASKEYHNYYRLHRDEGYGELDSHNFAYFRMNRILDEGR